MRISFVGGGTDLPSFYRKFGGAVVSTSVDKYMYVTLNEKFDDGIRISYSKTEEVASVDEVLHPLVREAMKMVGIKGGIEIASMADIPAKGSGLGSSSSFTAGLLHALYGYAGKYVSSEDLAAQSCQIEIDICGEPIGKQDQYAAAYGGLNMIKFNPDDSVSVDPIICDQNTIREMEKWMLVLYTGRVRSASQVLSDQKSRTESDTKTQDALKKMAGLTEDLKLAIEGHNLENFGEILHENWMLKKSLSSKICDSEIGAWYDTTRSAGAIGGKLLGAGNGGFLMAFAPPEKHEAICQSLSSLRPIKFGFDQQGSQIIFYRS